MIEIETKIVEVTSVGILVTRPVAKNSEYGITNKNSATKAAKKLSGK